MDKKKFTGTVTKFIDNFGFIDEEVFFRTEVVEGGPVKINDQVYVECEYSDQLPFKWNATKVKPLNSMQNRVNQQPASTYLQHRMQQQMLQQQPNLNQNINLLAAQQALPNLTPELRKLIEKQQQQQQQPQQQVQNFQQPSLQQQQQPNNQPQFNARQNDYNQPQAPFTGQITYTSQPGSAFLSPVLPFNQTLNVPPQQPTLPLSNLRAFQSNNQSNNYQQKRDNRPKDRDRGRKDDRNQRHDRDDKRGDNLRNHDRDNRDTRDRKPLPTRDRDIRDIRDNSTKDNARDRRNTESPSNSVTSSSNTSKPRRRYTPLNLPVHQILKTPLNTYEIKRKFDASLHIPSDFKEIQINDKFELNFKTLYKPVQYRIVHPTTDEESADKKESNEEKKENNDKSDKNSEKKPISAAADETKKVEESVVESKKSENEKDESISTDKSNDKSNDKSDDKSSSNDSKVVSNNKSEEETSVKSSEAVENKVVDFSSIKIKKKSSLSTSSSSPPPNKYAVKVLLLSIPSMNNIYDRVIESDRDTKDYSSSNKAYFLHFNKVFSFLCLKNHNDGHSLIGGKFDPKLDGYIDDNTPNLIQTAIRCVKQQTGIDLSSCKKWKHMCTFLYNRDDSPFYENVSFEYSNIFIPDIWSLLESSSCIKNDNKINLSTSDLNISSLDNSKIECLNGGDSISSLQVNPSDSVNDGDLSSINDSKLMDTTVDGQESLNDTGSKKDDSLTEISQLNDLKVTELRARLEELGHKLPKNVKKADLIVKLTEILKEKSESITVESVSKSENEVETQQQQEEQQQEQQQQQDEVVEKKEETMDTSNQEVETNEQQESKKRKAEDDLDSSIKESKKIKPEKNQSLDNSLNATNAEKSVVNKTKQLEAISDDGFIMAYGTSSTTLTVVNLYQALSHNKYDHFELAIASELLKEALIDHFANYILSSCYENRQLIKEQDKQDDAQSSKETHDNNYVLLAFSYFDSCHCGYVIADDLLKLFSCCGINFSKRTWTHIFGSNDRIKYKNFKEPTKVYNFTQQQKHQAKLQTSSLSSSSSNNQTTNEIKSSLYVKDGNVFDIEKLINQSECDEKLIVELKDKLKSVEDQMLNLQANLNDSEAKQKKMSSAYKKQNEEICDYKRDKERIKNKYEESLKLINSTLNNFNDFVKKHEDKSTKDRDKDKDGREKERDKDHNKDAKDSKDIKEVTNKDTKKE